MVKLRLENYIWTGIDSAFILMWKKNTKVLGRPVPLD